MDEKRITPAARRPALVAGVTGLGLLALVWFARPSAEPLPPLASGALGPAPAQTDESAGEERQDLDDPEARHRVALGALAGPPELERIAVALTFTDDAHLTEALRDRLADACLDQHSEEICDVLEAHPEWGVEVARKVGDGTVAVGMTAEQVERAWGEPFSREDEVVGKLWCYDDECLGGVKMLRGRVRASGADPAR